MRYDPDCEYSRQHLAITLACRLDEAGFKKKVFEEKSTWKPSTKEHVFSRGIEGTELEIYVYTTIVDDPQLGMAVRSTGKDAIRVNVRAPDVKLAIVKEGRVNRFGSITSIVERTIERARDAYRQGKKSGRCYRCGAQRALSKKGNWYCTKVCWKKPERLTGPKAFKDIRKGKTQHFLR